MGGAGRKRCCRFAKLMGYDGGMNRKLKWMAVVGLVLALLLYVGSYLILSRIAYAKARADGDTWGFWYVEPTGPSTETWYYWHCLCRRVYAPLNGFDCWLGTGAPPWNGGTWGFVSEDSQN